jgi:hypothetical protein
VLAKLVESLRNKRMFRLVETQLRGRLAGEVPRKQQLLKALVDYLGLLELALLPGLTIIHKQLYTNNIIGRRRVIIQRDGRRGGRPGEGRI